MRILIFLIAAALLAISPPEAWAWRAKVVAVADGDSVTVIREDDGEKVKIRLYGVDAPETKDRRGRWQSQPYARRSAAFLRGMLRPVGNDKSGFDWGGPFVDIAVIDLGLDKYDRVLAGIVTLPDGAVVQEELLKAGLAWVYPQYCKKTQCAAWFRLEEEARTARRGLWMESNPTPPWEWRKRGN